MEKTGQGTPIWVIIALVLGLVVLVVLIIGFTQGWDKVRDWFTPSSNLAAIQQNCETACVTGVKADFCALREVRGIADAELNKIAREISGGQECGGTDRINGENGQYVDCKRKKAKVTCETLANIDLISVSCDFTC